MIDEQPANDAESQLESMRQEHRELDRRIADLTREAGGNQLEIARLKKRKLLLKDRIQLMLDAAIPDIIA
jgi:hypothetical protein